MAAQEGHELDREAKAHMALAVLLRKKRAPEKRAQVRRILRSSLSTSQIVEAIKHLDSEEKEEPQIESRKPVLANDAAVFRREEPEDESQHLNRAPNPYRLTLPKLKSIIKRPRVRPSFFRYVFREYPRIAAFGRVTHIFSPAFLLPILRLERGIPAFFSESLSAWANELLSFLAPILVVSWRHLSKKHYNMIVALDRLCREITATNLHILSLRDRNLIDKLRNLETLFLSFHYRADSCEEVIEAIGEAMSREPELNRKAERAKLLASRLLEAEFTMPSLHNLLLGLNMLKSRTAITMGELLTMNLGEMFETESYACDPDVAAKIEALVDELKSQVAGLHREWSRLRRYKELVTEEGVTQNEFPQVRSLFEYTSSTLKSCAFEEDRKNVMDFAPNFFRRFESCCSPLLGGVIQVKGKRNLEVFVAHAFRNELDRLRLTASKLERSAFGFRSFPYTRYTAIKKEGKGGVTVELEIILLLQQAATALVSIGTKLEHVLSSAPATQTCNEQPNGEGAREAPAVDPAMMRSDRPVVIPHASSMIVKGNWLAGKTVRAAVSAVAAVCLQSALFLQENSFAETLSMEGPIHERIENELETIHRVADRAVYDQLVGALLGR